MEEEGDGRGRAGERAPEGVGPAARAGGLSDAWRRRVRLALVSAQVQEKGMGWPRLAIGLAEREREGKLARGVERKRRENEGLGLNSNE